MNGVTQLLQAASAGDPRAAAERIDAAMRFIRILLAARLRLIR